MKGVYKKMTRFNEIADKFLKANGIRTNHFAECIGRNASIVARWLKGEASLQPRDIECVHRFLNGEYFHKVDELMKEGE